MENNTFYATGKRKTSVARVWLKPGNGTIQVNKRTIEDYFPREALKSTALSPLQFLADRENFNIMITVNGGGISGQAGAIRHGIAKVLLGLDSSIRGKLKKEGMLTKDPRQVERKKYGQPKARKKFQFSKR